jgi:FeS assembly protein SufD
LAETTLNPRVGTFVDAVRHPIWTTELRAQALEQARAAAIPARYEEDWRKTDPNGFPWARVEQVDPAGSRTDVRSNAPAQLTGAPDALETLRQLQRIPGDDFDAKFLYYHRALDRAPVILRVPSAWSGETIEIEQRATGPGLQTFTTLVVVDAGAEVTVIDRWQPGDEDSLAIGRAEIRVGEGARLNYIQEDACPARASLYRRARIQIARNADVSWFTFTRGAAWYAARMEAQLMGPGSSALIRGLFAGVGDAHADHRTHQYHGAPRAKSDLTFKTLLSGHSHSIYQGLISVPRSSQKTDAYQQCRNLLLSPGTHADAIPKLEIIADDVRCTHGASMGSLNKDQLFYLQSRGLSRAQAMRTIATGFAEEIIRKVPVEAVQERWREAVMTAIGEAAGR